MPMNFKPGMAVAWESDQEDAEDAVSYGLILGTVEGYGLVVAPVYRLDKGMRCYDEKGSTFANDRDKIRLTECPRPFTKLCSKASRGQCYADGNRKHFRTFSPETALDELMIVEGDYLVSEERRREVIDHDWWYEWQREKLYIDDGFDPDEGYLVRDEDDDAGITLRGSVAEGEFIAEPGLSTVSNAQIASAANLAATVCEDEDEEESDGASLLSAIRDDYEPTFF